MEQAAIIELLNNIDRLLIRNVQRELQKRGWNQSELGRKIGHDPNKVSRFLTKGAWDSDLLLDIANALEIPAWELLMDAAEAISPERAVEILHDFVKKNYPPKPRG